MKKVDLGQAIAIVANLGVIAGIIFLAIELRQNNQLLQAEAIAAVLETRIHRQELMLTNPQFVEVVEKNDRGEPLSSTEQRVIRAGHRQVLLGWQKDFFLFEQGILSEDYLRANFSAMKGAFDNNHRTYSLMDHWQTWGSSAAPGFRELIEQCIIQDCETIP